MRGKELGERNGVIRIKDLPDGMDIESMPVSFLVKTFADNGKPLQMGVYDQNGFEIATVFVMSYGDGIKCRELLSGVKTH